LGLEERERAARDLSKPPSDYPVPQVDAPAERQPQDVVMARWLSACLVSYWLLNGVKRTSTGSGPGG